MYEVRTPHKVRRFKSGQEAMAFARGRFGAQVFYTETRMAELSGAEQSLVKSDKAKPPRGSCGAFCKGQTSRTLRHYVARETVETRIY